MALLKDTTVALLLILAAIPTAHAAYELRVSEGIPDSRLSQVQSVLVKKDWDMPVGRTIGAFAYWPEAAFAREALERDGGIGVSIHQADSNPTSITVPRGIFVINEASFSEWPDYQLDDQKTKMDAIERKLDGLSRQEQVLQLSDVLTQTETSNPLCGWLHIKRGSAWQYLGKYDAAMNGYKDVINGRTAATRDDRLSAIRKFAWCMHQDKNLVLAYKAYDEMEKITAQGGTTATATALMEKCGILLELAKGDPKSANIQTMRGTYDDCRKACSDALAKIDPAIEAERSTIALIHVETFYYEKKYEDCLAAIADWLETYPNSLRNKYMVLNFAGLTYEHLDKPAEREETLLTMLYLPEPQSDSERYSADGVIWDMKERALQWLIQLAKRDQDDKKIAQYEEMLALRQAARKR